MSPSALSELQALVLAGARPVAAAVAAGRVSATEVLDVCLAAIRDRDPDLHAFIALDTEGARRQAADLDRRLARGEPCGPLAGVPVGIKDNIDVAGLPTTGGIGHYRMSVPPVDAPVVARLREAGAVILGKLNLHEGALGATTDNPWFGRCDNPRRAGHTPGGSSGGSAAAVAAALCPVALGTDTLGSVRIPAAYCGVAAFKPGRGVLSTRGVMPLAWSLDHVGTLARSVADLALLHPVLAQPRSRWAGGRMAGGIRDAAGARDPGQDSGWPAAGVLGIVEDLAVSGIDPLALTMVRQAGRVLASDGVRTATVDLSAHDWTRTRREGFLVCEIEAAAFHGEALAADPEGFSPAFRDMLAYGLRQGGPRAALAAHRLAEAAEALAAALDPVDALLLPTVPQASFAHGEPAPANQADLTALANLLGAPAIALPWGGDARGLPLSVQLIGAPGSEQPLLDLAARLERLRPPEATPVAPSFRSPA